MSLASTSRAYAIRQVAAKDPSVELGYEIVFDDSLSLEFRNYEKAVSEPRLVRIRILTKKWPADHEKARDAADENAPFDEVRFEMFDDADLFFFAEASFTIDDFKQMKVADQLLISFAEFPQEVQTMLVEGSKESGDEGRVKFIEEEDGSGVMEFDEILELKSVEIFRIKFQLSDQEFAQQQAQYRYSVLAFEVARKKALVTEFHRQMQLKNPILLKAISTHGKSPRKK